MPGMNEHVFEKLGGVSGVARAAGVKPPSAHEWKDKPIPVGRCPRIEFFSNGAVTCEQLRPDVAWVRLPSPNWPGQRGKPCVDHAPELEAA